jgi:hypothetical protein
MVRTRKNHGFSGSLPFKHCPNGPNGPKWSVSRGASHGQFHRSLRGNRWPALVTAKDVCVHLWAVFWNTTGLLM